MAFRDAAPTRLLSRSIIQLVLRVAEAMIPPHGGDLTTALVYSRVAMVGREDGPGDPAAGAVTMISAHEVANSLQLPYETVRVRITRMIAAGACVRRGFGVFIPEEAFHAERQAEARRAMAVAAADVIDRMIALGISVVAPTSSLDGTPSGSLRSPRWAACPADRMAVLLTRFVCDCLIEANGIFGSFDRTFIMLSIADRNLAPIQSDPEAAWRYAAGPPVPDSAREPVSNRALAREIGVPAETVRRHMLALTETGHLTRVDARGYIVPSTVFAAESPFMATTRNSVPRFLELLGTLEAAGLCPPWDVLAPPPTPDHRQAASA